MIKVTFADKDRTLCEYDFDPSVGYYEHIDNLTSLGLKADGTKYFLDEDGFEIAYSTLEDLVKFLPHYDPDWCSMRKWDRDDMNIISETEAFDKIVKRFNYQNPYTEFAEDYERGRFRFVEDFTRDIIPCYEDTEWDDDEIGRRAVFVQW